MLADECTKRVVIVDTSNEIGGDGDIPHPGIGRARRMQVRRGGKGVGAVLGAWVQKLVRTVGSTVTLEF